MALGAEHVQAAELAHLVVDLDVDSAARHVRRDRDSALQPRADDDLAFALVLLGVEHVVRDATSRQELGQVLGRLHRDRADQYGLPDLVARDEVIGHRVPLRFLALEDVVVLVLADDVDVRRDRDHVEVVDLDELLFLRLRGAGHAAELLVEAEVVLEGDRRERDVLLADLHALLRLDRLVQAFAPATPLHDPAGVLVDDLHLAVLDHVVDIALVQRLGLERLAQVVDELHVARVVEVVHAERVLDRIEGGLRRRHGLVLLVVEIVRARQLGLVLSLRRLAGRRLTAEIAHDPREVVVGGRCRLRLAGDDERRARLVDQD